jgi:hypothetical protein
VTLLFSATIPLNARKQENSYQCFTYEYQISTVPQQSSAGFFQEINCFYSVATTRPIYDESCEVSARVEKIGQGKESRGKSQGSQSKSLRS